MQHAPTEQLYDAVRLAEAQTGVGVGGVAEATKPASIAEAAIEQLQRGAGEDESTADVLHGDMDDHESRTQPLTADAFGANGNAGEKRNFALEDDDNTKPTKRPKQEAGARLHTRAAAAAYATGCLAHTPPVRNSQILRHAADATRLRMLALGTEGRHTCDSGQPADPRVHCHHFC